MADSRGAPRPSWVRARKARPPASLSRGRRSRLGAQRGVGVGGGGGCKRLRRRLLQAQAAGEAWREGAREVRRPGKTPARRPDPAPDPAPSPDPGAVADSDPDPDPDSGPGPARGSKSTALHLSGHLRPLGPGRVLMLLPVEKGLTFSGYCRVTCLYGQIQVLGFTISAGQPAQDLFSSYTHSRLCIDAVHYFVPEKCKKEIRKDVRLSLKPHVKLEDRNWVISNFSPLCSVVLLERLQNATVNYILSHPGLSSIFFQEAVYEHPDLKDLDIRKDKVKNGLRLTESALSALEELVSDSCEEVDGCSVILVCGHQDIGKSTFNRYLINQLLNSLPCVDYLECDLGQTEFTPPGCISLLNVTEPILGPPFMHQRTPQKMVYLGKPTCKDSCENYIEAVKFVFGAYKREAPLIVNTMGWVTGQGLKLLVDLIRLLVPSHVVQLRSDRSPYMPNLTASDVDVMDGLYTRSKALGRDRGFHLPKFPDSELADEEQEGSGPVTFANHKLLIVQSEFTFRKMDRNREQHNKVLRDLAVLGYLGLLQPPVPKPLCPLQGLTPYQVPFNAVALRVLHADVAPTHILYAVNASWLGLCHIVDEVQGDTHGPILLAQTPLCDCLGFGEDLSGIDMEKKLYHILTPIPPEKLRTVNCLLLGAISIPHFVFQNQRGPEGTIPYVTTDYNLKLPGALEKIGAREMEDMVEEKLPPRARLYKKRSLRGALPSQR